MGHALLFHKLRIRVVYVKHVLACMKRASVVKQARCRDILAVGIWFHADEQTVRGCFVVNPSITAVTVTNDRE